MIVVCDASPLNYLILIDNIELLARLFGRVIAPVAVVQELQHPESPPAVRSWASSPPEWLEVLQPQRPDSSLPLGDGERDAIALAQEIGAQLVLIDERAATGIATRLGLTVAGTLAVLDLAAERKLVDLPSAVASLRQTTFRATDALYDEILRRDAARRRT